MKSLAASPDCEESQSTALSELAIVQNQESVEPQNQNTLLYCRLVLRMRLKPNLQN